MRAGGLTIERGFDLIDGGALTCGGGAWGWVFVFSGVLDLGAGLFRGLTAATVTGFSFTFATGVGVFFACDGEVATVAGDGGGLSGLAGVLFWLFSAGFVEERAFWGAPIRGCRFTFFSVCLGFTVVVCPVAFFLVDKADNGLG